MHLTVVVMHGTRNSIRSRRRAVWNRRLFMAHGSRRLMCHAAGARDKRREQRHLEKNPGGRQKTQVFAEYCHLPETD